MLVMLVRASVKSTGFKLWCLISRLTQAHSRVDRKRGNPVPAPRSEWQWPLKNNVSHKWPWIKTLCVWRLAYTNILPHILIVPAADSQSLDSLAGVKTGQSFFEMSTLMMMKIFSSYQQNAHFVTRNEFFFHHDDRAENNKRQSNESVWPVCK